MNIDLTIDVKAASKYLESYQRKRLPSATRMALNKTIRGVLTDTKKVTSKLIGMTQREIGQRTTLRLATPTSALASLTIKGERRVPNLIHFKAKKQGKKGVSARVWEKQKTYRGTFIVARGRGTVFKRVGSATVGPTYKTRPSKRWKGAVRRIKRGPRKGQVIMRQPITPVFGTSLRRVFVRTPRTGLAPIDTVRALAVIRFRKELNLQLARIKK